MTSRESGRADTVALALSVLLAAGASAPDLVLRSGPAWRKCRERPAEAPPGPSPAPEAVARERGRVNAAVARAEGLLGTVATAVFRPDPTRFVGPLPSSRAPGTFRVENLEGKVADGRLSLRWTPVPGSRATLLRMEGLGGPGPLEREMPADRTSLLVPVPGAAGRIVVRAIPVGASGPAAESRISIPFRIPVEVLRAERASPETQSAILVLRRVFDGAAVEAEFALHGADTVGGLSPAGPGGPPVEFLTDYVVDGVRLRSGGDSVIVPEFEPDGRVARDADGVPAFRSRQEEPGGIEVVLRGLNDERRVLDSR